MGERPLAWAHWFLAPFGQSDEIVRFTVNGSSRKVVDKDLAAWFIKHVDEVESAEILHEPSGRSATFQRRDVDGLVHLAKTIPVDVTFEVELLTPN